MVDFILGFLVGLLIITVLIVIWAWVDGVNEDLKYLKNERQVQIEYNKITEKAVNDLYRKLDEVKTDE